MRNAFALRAAAARVLLASPAPALEKRSVRFDESGSNDWAAGATCRVSYYNVCTGWIWCWGPFPPNNRLGVVVEDCCPIGSSASLLSTSIFLCDEAHVGYGSTGTIAVHAVDANRCPVGAPLAIQNYCPTYSPNYPFSIISWSALQVPQTFAIIVTSSIYGIFSPATYGSDHPAAGPTGPEACGVCFPVNRVARSFYYGTIENPLCPGSTFNDGICDAELFWDIDFACPVSVEESSWGTIKGLYR